MRTSKIIPDICSNKNCKSIIHDEWEEAVKNSPRREALSFFTALLLKIQVFQNAVNRSGTDTEYPEQLPDINTSLHGLC